MKKKEKNGLNAKEFTIVEKRKEDKKGGIDVQNAQSGAHLNTYSQYRSSENTLVQLPRLACVMRKQQFLQRGKRVKKKKTMLCNRLWESQRPASVQRTLSFASAPLSHSLSPRRGRMLSFSLALAPSLIQQYFEILA